MRPKDRKFSLKPSTYHYNLTVIETAVCERHDEVLILFLSQKFMSDDIINLPTFFSLDLTVWLVGYQQIDTPKVTH